MTHGNTKKSREEIGACINWNADHYPYTDNLLMVGDAAGLNYAGWVGGIELSLKEGKVCGDVAAKAIKEGDCSEKKLMEYGNLVRKVSRTYFGEIMGVEVCNRLPTAPEYFVEGMKKMTGNSDLELGYKFVTGKDMKIWESVGFTLYFLAFAPKVASWMMKKILGGE